MLVSLSSDQSGEIALSAADKPRQRALRAESPVHSSRRDFLLRCCQGVSAALNLREFHWSSLPAARAALPSGGEFHLHPHYREQLPLEDVFRKTIAGSDEFITEKYAEEIEAIFAGWSSELRQSAQGVRTLEKVLDQDFRGMSLRPAES